MSYEEGVSAVIPYVEEEKEEKKPEEQETVEQPIAYTSIRELAVLCFKAETIKAIRGEEPDYNKCINMLITLMLAQKLAEKH